MTLDELEKRLETPRRMIRYLIAQGILPSALGTGRGADAYGDEHVWRGEKFRDLSDLGFSVPAIKLMLDHGIVSMTRETSQVVFQNEVFEASVRDAKALARLDENAVDKLLVSVGKAVRSARAAAIEKEARSGVKFQKSSTLEK